MEWDRDSFAAAQDSSFKVSASDGQSVDVKLIEVSELKETARQRSFSIVFAVPETHRIGQGLYDVQHPTLGSMQLFLVPINGGEGGQEIEAVFNTLKTDG